MVKWQYILPIDAIITIPPNNPLAHMAHNLGFLVGTHSSVRACVNNRERWNWAFPLSFIDCEFKKYNHQKHMDAIQANKPKYATVRDLMTREQCQKEGIEWFDFDTIMQWAQEIEQYAENIIVIPKYNCLSDIPERYVLGYSIPTKYAGTPLPREMFKGRKVHLLGGSWKRQREYLQFFGKDTISLDNNNLWKVSVYGTFDTVGGQQRNLKDYDFQLTSVMYTCVCLSLGAIAQDLHEMYNTKPLTKTELPRQMALF